MKRGIAWIVTAALLMSCCAVSPMTASAEEELVSVYVDTYSQKVGQHTIEGYYRDNVFYISPSTVASLTGAEIVEQNDQTVTFSLHGGERVITVDAAADKMSEQQNKMLCHTEISAVLQDGEVYSSASALLRYMGAVVSYGENENSPTHMMVSMPYTVLDLIHEYKQNNGFRFRWSEADGKLIDPEDARALAALDTVLFAYDSNILAYAIPGHANKIEKQMHTDALLEVLKTDSSEWVKHTDVLADLLGVCRSGAQFTSSWVAEVLGWYADSGVDKALTTALADATSGVNIFLNGTEAIDKSLEVVQQFAAMNSVQKALLSETIAKVSPDSGLYKQLPLLFEAAKDAVDIVEGSYNTAEKAAWDGVYAMITNTATWLLSGAVPALAAWEQVAGIVKNTPVFSELINDEVSITYANDTYNMATIGDILFYAALESFEDANLSATQDVTKQQETIKYCAILSLKATLATRRLLVDTGWLKEGSAASMNAENQKAAALLNRAINAKPVPVAVRDTAEEDITWIRFLTRTGSAGWVNEVAGNTYYWSHTAAAFEKSAWNTVSYPLDDGQSTMMCRDREGNVTAWFTVTGVLPFAATDKGLYCSDNGTVYFYPFDRSNRQHITFGEVKGISRTGSHLVVAYGKQIKSVDVQSRNTVTISNDATFLTMHNDVVYYQLQLTHEEEMADEIKLSSANADGSDNKLLFHGKDQFYGVLGQSACNIMQMHFDDEYIYFSYGARGGSAAMYQGGRIARVRYDGTHGTVVAGYGDSLVSDRFTVTDGQVQTEEPEYQALAASMYNYTVENGALYTIDPHDGHTTRVVNSSTYALQPWHSDVAWVQRVGDRVYFMVHYGSVEAEYGWRVQYNRQTTILFCKDPDSDALEELVRF